MMRFAAERAAPHLEVTLLLPTDPPAALAARAERVAARLAELAVPLPAELSGTATRVCVVSEFVLRVLSRFPAELAERLADAGPLDAQALRDRLGLAELGEAQAMTALRRTRQIELARIAWRDLAGIADLDATLAETSMLAEVLIDAAVDCASRKLAARFGAPRSADGRDLPLLVLGMGKLGGRELNFSSDVDLVFLYPDSDESDGDEPALEAETYYLRVAQLLIKLLDQVTADGFVYRVDARLRPFGTSGPLAVSLSAFESYLVEHGRDWERYAYVKARLLTGLEFERDVFELILRPFVYRRYLDYGIFEALRQMKRLISQEVARKDMAENIKLGPGGIREIEFIVQVFQIVRGGQRAELRTRSLLKALPVLGRERQLPEDTVLALADAYRFLRTVENRLQALDDRQTHELPEGAEERARLAYALGEADWPALKAKLERERATVEAVFERIAWDAEGASGPVADPLATAWEAGDVEAMIAGTVLEGHEGALAELTDLRHGGLYQRMEDVGRQRLAAAMGRTVRAIRDGVAPPKALKRVLPVFRAICRRSAYLALLNENPAALERLLKLAAESAWLAKQIAEQPLLLDELLDNHVFDSPPSREELAALLARITEHVAPSDTEAALDAIRVFQRTAIFRIAVADRLGALTLMKVSDRLTDTAELVLEFSLDTAWRELAAKHGAPQCGSPPRGAGFAVIGYGKLGGLELGYGSDLDLVFLHDSSGGQQETNGAKPIDNERFFARLAQRLIHFLSIQTSSGKLYEVDTRLRPSGRAGLLVTSLEGFRHYQVEEAWVWEHQALLRSRALAGSRRVCEAFESIRREVLVGFVARDKLKAEVAKMRARMRAELSAAKEGEFDLKQDPGGIADIEFLVDYWVLANAAQFPDLVEFPDNIRQLEALERVGLVPPATAGALRDAYLALRQRIHELALDEGGRVVPADELGAERELVAALWAKEFGPTDDR
jgi:glutamate-ammonia-ligase adenylyltransferase